MPDILNPSTPGVSYSPYPPEMQAEAQALQRRRALADMLLLRSMQPLQQPTGWNGIPVPMSPLAGLSHIAQTGLAANAQTGLGVKEADLAGRYSAGLQGAIQDMQASMAKGDYTSAATAASRYPALKAISEKLFERQLPKFGFHEGIQVNENAPNPAAGATPLQTYTPTTQTISQPGGGSVEIPGSKASVTGKVTSPPANVFNVQNFPENKFATTNAEEQAKAVMKRLEGTLGKAQESASDLQTLNTAETAFHQGIKTGSFTEARNAIDRFAQTAGLKGPDDKIANTDTFMRTMSARILAHTKDIRPMSDPDREYLQSILAGKNLDERGLTKLFEIGRKNALGNITAHEALVAQHAKTPGSLPGFAATYGVQVAPELRKYATEGMVPSPTPAGPISLDEYLRRQQAK